LFITLYSFMLSEIKNLLIRYVFVVELISNYFFWGGDAISSLIKHKHSYFELNIEKNINMLVMNISAILSSA